MDVGIAQAKDSFSELIDRAEAGEVVTITRHGRPVVTIHPARAPVTAEKIERFLRELAPLRSQMPVLSDEEIVELVRDGRRY